MNYMTDENKKTEETSQKPVEAASTEDAAKTEEVKAEQSAK